MFVGWNVFWWVTTLYIWGFLSSIISYKVTFWSWFYPTLYISIIWTAFAIRRMVFRTECTFWWGVSWIGVFRNLMPSSTTYAARMIAIINPSYYDHILGILSIDWLLWICMVLRILFWCEVKMIIHRFFKFRRRFQKKKAGEDFCLLCVVHLLLV